MLLSKEIFPYDLEKFVIICIISFILISYFSFKDTLYNTFLLKSNNLKQDYTTLILLNQERQQNNNNFLLSFTDLPQKLVNIKNLVYINIKNLLKKYNFKRNNYSYLFKKDNLNSFLRIKSKAVLYLNLVFNKQMFINFNNKFKIIRDLTFHLKNLMFKLLNFELNFFISAMFNKVSSQTKIIYI